MGAILKTPRNESVLHDFGPYPGGLNLGERETEFQYQMRAGLARFESSTQATLLTLVQVAGDRPVQFLDVGGHVGLHSLLVSTVYPPERVHVTAFEPTPRTAGVFRMLAGINQLPIHIERCAVGEAEGTAQLYISPWETSNSLQAGFREAQDEFTVPVISLDSYCAEHSIRPSVIKIDVETYETQVFLGAREILRQARPGIVCEILPQANRESTVRGLSVLSELGYHAHRWAKTWRPCAMDDIIDNIPHTGRDWLFTSEALDDRFFGAMTEWETAIGACTAETTTEIDVAEARMPPELYQPDAGHPAQQRLEQLRQLVRRLR